MPFREHPPKNRLIFTSNVPTLSTVNVSNPKSEAGIGPPPRFALFHGTVVAGLLIWCAGFTIPSGLWDAGGSGVLTAAGLRYFYSFICHQNPDRSFHLMGRALAVCARCTGVYFGMLAAAVSFPFVAERFSGRSPWMAWLAIVLGINALENGLSLLHWVDNLILRAGAGLILGLWIAFCALTALYSQPFILMKHGEPT